MKSVLMVIALILCLGLLIASDYIVRDSVDLIQCITEDNPEPIQITKDRISDFVDGVWYFDSNGHATNCIILD